MGLQQIVSRRWWGFSPLSLSHIFVSHMRLTFIDNPEVLPGQVPGAPSTSSSSSRSARSSSTNTATPVPVTTGGHSSNGGAIAGGVAGGIAAISLLVAGLFYYQRRRRSLASNAVPLSPDDSSFNVYSLMDQVPRPMSDQGTFASSFPETTSLMKPYVCVFVLYSFTCMCLVLF
jgi:hypothetical protein